MTLSHENIPLLVVLVGALLVLSIMIRTTFCKIRIPTLIGFFFVGFIIRYLDSHVKFMTPASISVFDFLSSLGVICLLFRIGVESNLAGLLHQLRHASFVWIGDVLLSGILGFSLMYFVFKYPVIPCIFVGIALTATSVGISVSIWQDANALKSDNGELLLDIAEMDDISGIVLLAILGSLIPTLRNQVGGSIIAAIFQPLTLVVLKLVVFGSVCFFFSRFIEERVTNYFRSLKSKTAPMLFVTAAGFIIAGIAGLIGFSVAIGAFFAGLVFSRDPDSVKLDTSFSSIHDLFTPFFFIFIGMSIDPSVLTSSLSLGLILLAVAIGAKLIGDGVPTFIMLGWTSALLIGISMIPRAEIAMIVMQKGLAMGDWAVPQEVFSAMVFVSAATCIIAPLVLHKLLQQFPQKEA